MNKSRKIANENCQWISFMQSLNNTKKQMITISKAKALKLFGAQPKLTNCQSFMGRTQHKCEFFFSKLTETATWNEI